MIIENTSFSENPVLLDFEKISYVTWEKKGGINVVSLVINGTFVQDALKLEDDDLQTFIQNLPPLVRVK